MPRADTRHRLERLDRLGVRLKADEAMTTAALAAEFGVSARTLARDIALLRDSGVPVETDRGRGGGVRIDRTWGVGRMALSYAEAVALLVSLAVAERMDAPWLLASLAPVRRKLSASFAPAMRARVDGLHRRIVVGGMASATVQSGLKRLPMHAVEALFPAFLEQRLLGFTYTDREGAASERRVEPQFLLLNYPVWYVLGWDCGRDGVRTFRCDRIRRARVLAEGFGLRPRVLFDEASGGLVR